MTTKSLKKVSTKYYCEKCDYYANRLSDLKKHYKTKKHNDYNMTTLGLQKTLHNCKCGKSYSNRQNLYRHKQRCAVVKNDTTQSQPEMSNNEPSMTEMFMQLMEKNQELQDQLLEIAKEPKTVINNQNSFNLNNFLNVQCRDAMNLSEFLEQIQITFQDLLYLGNYGFVESFKDTFIKQLKSLDQTMRPIHCTDQKRKACVVKENDKWEKDNTNEILYGAVDKVNRKQINAFSQHAKNRDKDFLDDDTNLDNNSKIIIEMCSYTKKNADAFHKKIMKHIAETSSINKQLL